MEVGRRGKVGDDIGLASGDQVTQGLVVYSEHEGNRWNNSSRG